MADGVIISPQFKKLKFGDVAEAAAKLPVPKDVALKPARPVHRDRQAPPSGKDTPSKVDGSAVYGIDVKLPNMLYAALAQPPTLGGSVKTFNDEKARGHAGCAWRRCSPRRAWPWSRIPGGARRKRVTR